MTMTDEPETIEADCAAATPAQLAAWLAANTMPAPPDEQIEFDPDDDRTEA
jgi:hypothetical protein